MLIVITRVIFIIDILYKTTYISSRSISFKCVKAVVLFVKCQSFLRDTSVLMFTMETRQMMLAVNLINSINDVILELYSDTYVQIDSKLSGR